MAGLSFIDVDLGKAAPFAVIAGIGFGLWYVWNKSQQQAQANAAETQASPLAAYQAAADLALLQSFNGGGTSATYTNAQGSVTGTPTAGITQNGTTVANPDLPQYSASNVTASTMPATVSQSIANSTASATSNGI